MKSPPSPKTKMVMLRFSPEQYAQIAGRAEKCKVRPATWMRIILAQVANRPETGYLRIREPNGDMT